MSPTLADETDHDTETDARRSARRIAVRSAAVAGAFSLVVSVLLIYDFSLRRPNDPLEATPEIIALRAALAEQPDNEALNEQYRELDRRLREEWAQRRTFSYFGGWLLLVGVAVFLIAAKWAATLRRQLPAPVPGASPQDAQAQWARAARWAVAALCVLLSGVAVVLRAKNLSAVNLDKLIASPNGGQTVVELPPPPSREEIARWWPRFRGPGGLGVSAYTNVPDSWDDKANQNIRWKEPVPLPGYSSPVVWGSRVFLSGADEYRREVYCFDADTGNLLWQRDVPATPQGRGKMKDPEYSGYAAPTAVTDGRCVYALFANGDVAALDFQGNLLWSRGFGIPDNSYGLAASLAMFEDLLLVQLDQGRRKDDKSKLLALDVTKQGGTAWQVTRPVSAAWASPIVIRHGGRDQIITCADPWVTAYAPLDGRELWRAKLLSQDVGPSPTYAGGMLYVVNDFPQLSAIRPDGEGDVTETHLQWIGQDGLPNTCSPLATEKYVLLLTDGNLVCYEARKGRSLWVEFEEFDAVTFTSSPSLVGDRVYLFGEMDKQDQDEVDEEGYPLKYCKTWIIEPGPEGCKVIGTCELDEGCVTSPAFQDGRIYIRGEKHLFCLQQEPLAASQ